MPTVRLASKAVLLSLSLLLAACGSSSNSSADFGTPGGPAVAGKSTDVMLPSNLDGETIAFTVHEPTSMAPGVKYPLVLQSHGYGGSRETAADRATLSPLYKGLLDKGYGLISIDERGHGDSGGTIRILDPDKEGKDLLQILDWAEAQLPWLAYRDGNLILGATGGSYGGGFQHLIYAIDPKHRLDAIAPEITWHDLRYSLYSGNVFKSFWATVLSAAGNAAGGGGKQDAQVNQGLIEGLTTGKLSQANIDLLYQNSLASYCEGNNPRGTLTKIDALYWQSNGDTLFNLTDAYNNYTCVKAKGGDVRFLSKLSGHDSLVGGASGEACGRLDKVNSILAWFDEKLKGIRGAADYVPKVCFNLDTSDTDGVVLDRFPVGGQSFQVPAQTVLAQEGSLQAVSVVLMKAGADGAVVAGVPRIKLEITDPAGAGLTEPIVFVALAKRAAGASTDTLLAANEVRPFRGFGSFDELMIGVASRLAKDDELRLVIQAANLPRYPRMGSLPLAPASVSATVEVPVLPANLPQAPAR